MKYTEPGVIGDSFVEFTVPSEFAKKALYCCPLPPSGCRSPSGEKHLTAACDKRKGCTYRVDVQPFVRVTSNDVVHYSYKFLTPCPWID